jgi:3'-phosphoadenosine 5'-phosphosulfate sulfotransferase (PAPS reductase)/FAD synthetase
VIRRRAWIKNGCNAFENVRPVSTPIAFWTKKDIWDYIEQSHLDYCDIYKMGYNRSGCCFCLMGIQNPQESKRLIRLKNTHPHIYKYIMEQLHLNEIIDEMNKSPCIRIQY